MTKVAILQSSYIPWKGYFDIINSVDHFVIYDAAQYTKRDWRNRNRIKTSQGLKWLTIPVRIKGRSSQAVQDVEVADASWQSKHWATLRRCYARSSCFDVYADRLEEFYHSNQSRFLSDINTVLITMVNWILGIETKIHYSHNFKLRDGKSERLLGICTDLGADAYLSGPSARGYLDEELFRSKGIDVEWMDYSGYKPYRQLYPPFAHEVTILDLLFNEGVNARHFMKSFQ